MRNLINDARSTNDIFIIHLSLFAFLYGSISINGAGMGGRPLPGALPRAITFPHLQRWDLASYAESNENNREARRWIVFN